MTLIEKLEPLLLVLAALLGLILAQQELWGAFYGFLVEPALTLLLIGIFFTIPFKDFLKGFVNLKFTLSSLALNFIWTPFFGFILAAIFLNKSPDIRLGFLMFLVTPCTDWYLVFTAMAKGNVPLSASILPLNLILQLMLLPFFIWLFEGLTKAGTQTQAALAAIPILLTSLIGAKILAFLFKKRPKGLPRQLGLLLNQRFWLLFLAVAAMFAQYGGLVIERLKTFPNLLAAVIGFFFINLILVLAYTRLARFSYQDCASLCLTSLARNSPVALVVAAGAFPDRPMVSLTLIIGPLIELPVLALIAHVLRRYIAK